VKQTISRDQIAEFDYVLQDFPDFLTEILKAEGIDKLADLTRDRYRDVIERTRQVILLKRLSDSYKKEA
jgi:hypothetical protein